VNAQRRWFCLSAVALGLLTAVTVVAEKVQQKEPPYPQSLFAKATPDDYMGEKDCTEAGCHYPHADNFNRSPHAPFMRNPKLPLDKQGCEGCHGPANPHLEDPKKIFSYSNSKPQTSQQCACAAMPTRCACRSGIVPSTARQMWLAPPVIRFTGRNTKSPRPGHCELRQLALAANGEGTATAPPAEVRRPHPVQSVPSARGKRVPAQLPSSGS
jgi:hypothetical protein